MPLLPNLLIGPYLKYVPSGNPRESGLEENVINNMFPYFEYVYLVKACTYYKT